MLSKRMPDAFAKSTEAAVAAVLMLNVPVPVRLAAVAESGTPALQVAVLQFVPVPDQVVCPKLVWLRAAMVKMTLATRVAKRLRRKNVILGKEFTARSRRRQMLGNFFTLFSGRVVGRF
jgi:hypothetical protein